MDRQPAAGATCASCGTANRPGRKFCAECGATLAVPCPSCATPNEPGERFCGECGSPLAPAPPASARPEVERRLVSVLFADLVGFTTLSETRDPEDVRELLSRYFDSARTVVERYGGTVEKFIGDAVMAVWGTPTAREDDAERAVRAALELVPSVGIPGAVDGADIAVRAGVLTGEAAVHLGAEGQGMVAGDLVNAASRVQGLAEPGTVLVGEATRRATEASIAYRDAGVHALKGKAEPLRIWQALRVTAGRGGELASQGLEPPFVGRERELHLLKELFHASAAERRAHLVSIVGIAGIGKSRLVAELRKHLDGVAGTINWHQGRCLAYGDGVSFWALAEMVRMRAGIKEGEEQESAREKLRSMLGRYVDGAEERAWIEPRLAQLLALDVHDGGEPADLFAGWRLFFERLADHDPVLLVFEDVQWADPPLFEFLDYLLDWSRRHPIFVVALARPEPGAGHGWAAGTRSATTLPLEPLSAEAIEALLDGLVPGLPRELRRQVLDRAEGVPLYAVETVRMLLDRGLLERHGGEYRTTRPIEALEVPETLHALVAARLDGLAPDERRLVQDASVLGKSFPRSALVAASGISEEDVDRVLAGLVRKEVLSLEAEPRSPELGQYRFLQDLLRQIAYETMPRGERKARHLAAAGHLEAEWTSGEQEIAEIVASHYVTALELDPGADDAPEIGSKARATLVAAGERAASLAASESAQRAFERALALAEGSLERAELHERAGRMAMLGSRAGEARAHFEQAIEAFTELGLTHPAARVTAELGILTWQYERDLARAVSDMERSFAVLVEDEHDADLATLAVHLARVLLFAGRIDEAAARNELALEIAERLRRPEVLSHGLNTKSLILGARGRHEEAELLLRHSLEVALAHDLSDAALRGYNNLVVDVAFRRDRASEALVLARAAVELARRVGRRDSEIAFTGFTVACLLELGRWEDALAADETLALHERDLARAAAYRTFLAVAPLLVHRGELGEARRRVLEARELVDPNEAQQAVNLAALESLVLLADGNAREALARAEEAAAALGSPGSHWAARTGLSTGLAAALSLGDEAKVDELLAIVEELAPGELTPSLRAVGARFGARRAALDGDEETAHAGFLAAAEILRELERPFDLALVLLEHAELLIARGRTGDARPLLDEARDIFERLAAGPWLERLAAAAATAEPALAE